MHLIEINKGGILTVVGIEVILTTTMFVAMTASSDNGLLGTVMKNFLVTGAIGISFALFYVTATIQEKERLSADTPEKNISP